MFNLNDYRSKKNSILSDENLSEKGKEQALKSLKVAGKKAARKEVERLRKEAVINSLYLREAQEERLEKAGQSLRDMDFSRLVYEVETIKSRLKASESIEDVMMAWQEAKSSDDVYVLKAWKDISIGLIADKFHGDELYTDGRRDELVEDIKQAEVKVETGEQTAAEQDALQALREIEGQAKEVNEAFGSGQAVVSRVFDKIDFKDGHVELGFDYEIHKLSEKQETPSEVAYRLEREYQQSFEEYDKLMRDKGLDKGLDKDFDDLSGVF